MAVLYSELVHLFLILPLFFCCCFFFVFFFLRLVFRVGISYWWMVEASTCTRTKVVWSALPSFQAWGQIFWTRRPSHWATIPSLYVTRPTRKVWYAWHFELQFISHLSNVVWHQDKFTYILEMIIERVSLSFDQVTVMLIVIYYPSGLVKSPGSCSKIISSTRV